MESRELISVIVPVYKVESYIRECILSIINQSCKNFELILIDDAGGDKSIEIAKELLMPSNLNWRIITNSRNRGLSYSRNIAVKNAYGSYLFFLDSDDYIEADCLLKLYEEMYRTKADMVYGGIVYDMDGLIHQSPWCYSDADICSCEPILLHITQKAFSMACNRLINKQFYDRCGICFKEGILHEDEPWSFSLILRTSKISFVKSVTYYYRKRLGSITMSKCDLLHLDSIYYHLLNCSHESYQFDIWKNKEFRNWYAQLIFHFCTKVFSSKLNKNVQIRLLDKVFSKLRIPEDEMNKITLYSFAKKMSNVLSNYRWLKFIVIMKQLKKRMLLFCKHSTEVPP